MADEKRGPFGRRDEDDENEERPASGSGRRSGGSRRGSRDDKEQPATPDEGRGSSSGSGRRFGGLRRGSRDDKEQPATPGEGRDPPLKPGEKRPLSRGSGDADNQSSPFGEGRRFGGFSRGSRDDDQSASSSGGRSRLGRRDADSKRPSSDDKDTPSFLRRGNEDAPQPSPFSARRSGGIFGRRTPDHFRMVAARERALPILPTEVAVFDLSECDFSAFEPLALDDDLPLHKLTKQEPALATQLCELLDEAWTDTDFKGAAFMDKWSEIKKAVRKLKQMEELSLTADVPPAKEEDDPEQLNLLPKAIKSSDLLLVINVLARSRAGMLKGDEEVSLRARYLKQGLYSGNPALVALARESDHTEEQL